MYSKDRNHIKHEPKKITYLACLNDRFNTPGIKQMLLQD